MELVKNLRYTLRVHHRYKNGKFTFRDQIWHQRIFLIVNTLVPRPWDAVAVVMNSCRRPNNEEAISPWP